MREHRNYLRVRGEYFTGAQSMTHTMGTTSACAENTHGQNPPERKIWNYLRVRGEYGDGAAAQF